MKIKKEDIIEAGLNIVVICVVGMLIYFVSKVSYTVIKTLLELL